MRRKRARQKEKREGERGAVTERKRRWAREVFVVKEILTVVLMGFTVPDGT